MLFNRRNRAATPTRMPKTSTSASAGARANVELTTRNSLMKIPSGGKPAMATTPRINVQPRIGWVSVRPPISAIRCVPLTCAIWPTAKNIAGVVSEGMVMCNGPAKFASGSAHAEGKSYDAHMLDRRIGEHAFDVAPPVQHEDREDE